MINLYLLTKILEHLECHEISRFVYIFPKSIGKHHANKMANCSCHSCSLLYWMCLASLTHKGEVANNISHLKKCAKVAKIQYIRGLHYRERSAFSIYTNYLFDGDF